MPKLPTADAAARGVIAVRVDAPRASLPPPGGDETTTLTMTIEPHVADARCR
jgi:hypothetical protein